MQRQEADFRLDSFSDVWWFAPRNLGGHEPYDFVENVIHEDLDEHSQLLEQGLVVPVCMYSDCGPRRIRLVLGELGPREAEDWVAQSSWKLDLRSGDLFFGSSGDPDDYYETDLYAPELYADPSQRDEQAFCYATPVPPAIYRVNVYSYPPQDMLGVWNSIVAPGSWAGSHPEAEPLKDYFSRTRPGEAMPAWIADPENLQLWDGYLMFLVQLLPLQGSDTDLVHSDGLSAQVWKKRKPERCPLGVDDWAPEKGARLAES